MKPIRLKNTQIRARSLLAYGWLVILPGCLLASISIVSGTHSSLTTNHIPLQSNNYSLGDDPLTIHDYYHRSGKRILLLILFLNIN